MDLEALVDKIHRRYSPKKLFLVGASWGSLVSLTYLASPKPRIDGYVGIGQMIRPLEALTQQYELIKKIRPESTGGLPASPWRPAEFFRFVRIADKNNFYPNKIDHSEVQKIQEQSPLYAGRDLSVIERGQERSFSGLIKPIQEWTADKLLIRFKGKVLFLQGEFDWITPVNLVSEFANKRDNMSVLKIPDYGHNLLLENPKAVERAIRLFYRDIISNTAQDIIERHLPFVIE